MIGPGSSPNTGPDHPEPDQEVNPCVPSTTSSAGTPVAPRDAAHRAGSRPSSADRSAPGAPTTPRADTSNGPDLAALREACDDVEDSVYCLEAGDLFVVNEDGEPMDFVKQQEWANTLLGIVRETLAVLSLVDRLQAENERLRKGLTRLCDYGAIADEFVRAYAAAILAGSPAANKEQQ